MTVSGLVVREIRLAYGPTLVLNQVSLDIELNQSLAILGQSGCGKTTLLKVVAGLVAGSDGSVLYDGSAIDHLSAAQRKVVYLDQDPLLFEHLNVFENVAFAMRLARRPRNEIKERVAELLAAVELTDHANKRSWQLSGGQKQRVAFARAILANPRVLLLDEPFGSLDSRSRANMQQLFLRLREQYSITCLFVTHDVKEALVVGDRLALMADGKLKQYSSHGEFMQDESTGAASEREFWLKQEQR